MLTISRLEDTCALPLSHQPSIKPSVSKYKAMKIDERYLMFLVAAEDGSRSSSTLAQLPNLA